MRSIIFTLCILCGLSLNTTFAQDLSALKSLNITRPQIKKTLEELHKMGKITDEQFQKASKELDEMSDSKMNALIIKGQQMGAEMAKEQGAQMDLKKQMEELKKKSE